MLISVLVTFKTRCSVSLVKGMDILRKKIKPLFLKGDNFNKQEVGLLVSKALLIMEVTLFERICSLWKQNSSLSVTKLEEERQIFPVKHYLPW